MTKRERWIGSVVAAAAVLSVVACSSSDEPTTYNSGTGGTGGGGTGGGAGQAGSAGQAGTGGGAGQAGSGGAGGVGGEDAGTGGSGGGVAGDHLLISEIGILSNDAEFIELYNPTSSAVDLSDYYLSDNSAYHTFTAGPWNPSQTPGTDFLVRFPLGTSIPAGGVLVVGGNPVGYELAYGACPDFFLEAAGQATACGGGSVPAMNIPANGSLGDQAGALLSNDREMVVLFTWDGSSSRVFDVDYVTWGTDVQDASRIDKTGVAGYASDTPRASQKAANAAFGLEGGVPEGGASAARSIERCNAMEPGETLSGGNGLTGHDETSEDLGASFSMQEVPSPGAKNTCL